MTGPDPRPPPTGAAPPNPTPEPGPDPSADLSADLGGSAGGSAATGINGATSTTGSAGATGTSGAGELEPVPWWRAEPGRLARDEQELAVSFPALSWCEPDDAVRGAGGWCGQLPLWPFTRPHPPGLKHLEFGLHLTLVYPQAYPLVAPRIYPQQPAPELMARTDHRWHLNGDGSLCLLQDTLGWRAEDSVTDLLLKAAGWRVEYALMRAGLLEAMTESGIVSDPVLDAFISYLPASDASGSGPTLASDLAWEPVTETTRATAETEGAAGDGRS